MCAKCDTALHPFVEAQLQQLTLNLQIANIPPTFGYAVLIRVIGKWRRDFPSALHPDTRKPLSDAEFLDLFTSAMLEYWDRVAPPKPRKERV